MLTILGAALAIALADSPDARFTLTGRVLDPTGSVVSRARVIATSANLRSTPPTATDANGSFTLRLPPGDYTVTVAVPGFVESSQSVTAAADGGETREFVLKVAPFGETITVSAREGYEVEAIASATKTFTRLRDLPQSVTVTTKELIRDQLMLSVGDVMRYTPGIQVHQGENNRDQVIIRGNSSSADFFVNGVRDDVQYYRDLYNLDRIEALKGPNAMMFGRGGGGGVVNRVSKEAGFTPIHEFTLLGGSYGNKRFTADFDQPVNDKVALRLNAM